MKKFIIKSSFFVLPFLVLHFINIFFSQRGQGDLARLGYLYYNPSPYKEIEKKFSTTPEKAKYLTELDLNKRYNFDVLTIGDSFSEQGGAGYQKPLINKGLSVIHIDRFISEESPIQNLVSFANSDFFDYIKPKYVILQNVERRVIDRNEELSFAQKKSMDSVKNLMNFRQKREKEISDFQESVDKIDFFSDTTIKSLIINMQYIFFPRSYKGEIYRYKSIRNNIFTNNPNEIMVYQDDIRFLKDKNDTKKIDKLNDNFNKINKILSEKGIKLIVLIAPDKYDMYYPYIKNKNKDAPIFFQYFDKLKKDYLYVPSYDILSNEIKHNKDVYFYDDTHWSPNGSYPIGEYILEKIIKKD